MSDGSDLKYSAAKVSKLALLWGQAQPAVTAYIRASLRDHHDCEDVTQATAQYIVKNFDDYDPATPFTAWAIGVARYRILGCIRQQQRHARVLSDDVIQILPKAFIAMESKALPQQDALEQCVQKLNDRSKGMLFRKYSEGASHRDIAKSLDVAPNTVTVLLRRIREKLAKCIESRMAAEERAHG